ncbi:P-loop containing nucleoside triphosphate hydrolase protein, partial [Ilyonectria destructans]
MVCPPTMASYVLGEGEWKIVNVDEVRDVYFQDDLFDKLILPETEKYTMSDLVTSQMEIHKSSSRQIGGRARNRLIVLLHGGAGTGKTFTATAMAEKIKCPLLVGTVELGGTIADFELGLNRSFQLAQRWGALLLLEEVDSFMTLREESESSYLTAIFAKTIQAIDKYNGVLFVTTRRVGVLDEAVHSRINYAVHYVGLSREARRLIWNMAAPEISYENERLDLIEFNGRDIQTVVLAARQLASRRGDGLRMDDMQHILNARINFSSYLTQV